MRKIEKICALVVMGMFVCMMLTPSVMAPETESELPFWGTEGNEAGKKDVLGTTNERDLKIITNGEQRMVITSDGNVGIGTTSPSGELEVVGNIVVSGTVDGVDIDVEINELNFDIDAERVARMVADVALQNNIDAEAAARAAADAGLQAGLDAEEAARIAADIALQNNIDTEEAARIAADIALQNNIDTEEAARTSADVALQTQVDDLQSQIDSKALNQLIQDFVVATGESVTAGDVVSYLNGYVQKWDSGVSVSYGSEYVFDSLQINYISTAALSSNKFVLAYQDGDNSLYGTAVIGEVCGNKIFFGAEYVYNSANTWLISTAALSSDKFVVVYCDRGNSYYGTAVIGDVYGNTITFGAEYVYNPGSTYWNSVATISSDKFVVAFSDYSNHYDGTAVIGDVSGNTIVFGSEYVFTSGYPRFISASVLSSTKFMVAYQDAHNSFYGTAVIGDVSFNTITFGSEYVFKYAVTEYISAAGLSSNKFVVTYQDTDNNKYGTAIIGEVTSNTISFGSEYVYNPDDSQWNSVATILSDKFVVVYMDRGSPTNYGTAVIGDVTGNTISFGSEYVFKFWTTRIPVVTVLSSNKFVVAWESLDGGVAIIGDMSIPIVGIAKESKTAGETVPVIIDGISDVHSGLSPGLIYYLDEFGSLTIDITSRKIGLAISSTEILLADPFF